MKAKLEQQKKNTHASARSIQFNHRSQDNSKKNCDIRRDPKPTNLGPRNPKKSFLQGNKNDTKDNYIHPPSR
jgi:hypothetical protein